MDLTSGPPGELQRAFGDLHLRVISSRSRGDVDEAACDFAWHIMIALTVIAPAAQAGSLLLSISGHRFHVEASRNCRSTSCVSVSSRALRTTDDVGTTSPAARPPPVVQTPQPVYPATAGQRRRQRRSSHRLPPCLPPRHHSPSRRRRRRRNSGERRAPDPPRVELSRLDPPKTLVLPPTEPPVANPNPKIHAGHDESAPRSDERGGLSCRSVNGERRRQGHGPASNAAARAVRFACDRGVDPRRRRAGRHEARKRTRRLDRQHLQARSSGNCLLCDDICSKSSGTLHVEAARSATSGVPVMSLDTGRRRRRRSSSSTSRTMGRAGRGNATRAVTLSPCGRERLFAKRGG